jgi:hypothetical protein
MIDAWDLVEVRVPRSALKQHDDATPDPYSNLFGAELRKPRENLACQAMTVRPKADVEGPPGVFTRLAIHIETIDREFSLSMDERSARFIMVCLAELLCPYPSEDYRRSQSLKSAGTPSAEAAKPSAASCSPFPILRER